MATDRDIYECKRCGEPTEHLEKKPSHLLHLILTILTLGLWAVVWVLLSLGSGAAKCTECGKKRGAFGLW